MYNDRNHRVKKESYHNGSLLNSTFYVRDVAGQVMAIYTEDGSQPQLVEQPIYGAARIGVQYTHSLAVYELTDHLGNVRALFTKESATDSELEGYTDYYPGGMAIPNRNIVGDYRYGYQGEYSEKDEETGLNAFQLRMYDSRINRWISPDPAGQYFSPYLSMGNNWINAVDPDGGYVIIIGGDPKIKRYLNRLLATPIGQEVLKEYINNPHKHLHIGFGPDTNTNGKSINAVTLDGSSLQSRSTGVISGNNLGPTGSKIRSHYFPWIEGVGLQKGDNRFILLNSFSNNTEDRQVQSLFHEITAHNYIPDLLGGRQGMELEHLMFSQHPEGFEMPGDVGASILTHFLDQFRNQFQLFNLMNFGTTPDNFSGEKIISPRFF